MAAGNVKWFNNAKGYGFVCVEGIEQDILIHHSSIQMEGYRTLRAGQPVLLTVVQGQRGLQAASLIPADGLTAEQCQQAEQKLAQTSPTATAAGSAQAA